MNRRVGVILSGGAASGMNAGLEELVTQLFSKGIEVYGFIGGWKGIIKKEYKVLTPSIVKGISDRGGGIISSCTKTNIFAYRPKKYARKKDFSKICEKNLLELGIEFLFSFGGDGTNRQTDEFIRTTSIKAISVFFTLDCDVSGTSKTVGSSTASYELSREIIAMSRDGDLMERHTATEGMGRASGANAVYATALAMKKTHVDILIIPEVPYSFEKLANFIEKAKHPLTIVIAEGAKQGELQSMTGDHKSLNGTGKALARKLKKERKISVKPTICGYVQRSGDTTQEDQDLAKDFVDFAVKAFLEGKTNVAVCYDEELCLKDLSEVAKLNRTTQAKGLSLNDPVLKELQDAGVYFGN